MGAGRGRGDLVAHASQRGRHLPYPHGHAGRLTGDVHPDRALTDFGKLDIMGNIAGVPSRGMVVDVTEQELDSVLGINLKGVFYGCQAAMRAMSGQGSGNIVNVASGAIDSGAPTLAVYSM